MTEIIGDADELITAVKHQARSEADAIVKKARRKADALQRQARQDADEKREEILEQARGEVERIRRQQAVRHGQADQGQYLQAREQALDQIWRQTAERLQALIEDKKAYADVLARLALAAAERMQVETCVLAADKKGHGLLTAKRLEKWSDTASERLQRQVVFEKADQPADIWGGMVIRDRDGLRRLDGSFATQLQMARTEWSYQVLQKLVPK